MEYSRAEPRTENVLEGKKESQIWSLDAQVWNMIKSRDGEIHVTGYHLHVDQPCFKISAIMMLESKKDWRYACSSR